MRYSAEKKNKLSLQIKTRLIKKRHKIQNSLVNGSRKGRRKVGGKTR